MAHDIQLATVEEVTVTKTLTGDTTLYQSGTFDVTVTCATVSQTFPFTPGVTMSGQMFVPQGELCTVSEHTGNAVVNGTSRKTIEPYLFVVGSGGQLVSVENELLAGAVSLAPLSVRKEVTGVMAGHDPTSVFEIDVQCPGVSPITFYLLNGQSGVTDVVAGSTCTITESNMPSALGSYQYAANLIPSQMDVPAAGRNARVVNEVLASSVTLQAVTFGISVVDVLAGPSGYVPGSILNTTLVCGGVTYNIPMAEGDQVILSIPVGAQCTSASAGALPPLNFGYYFSGPVMTPSVPFAVSPGLTVAIQYTVNRSASGPMPIPALDARALLLLMGLLSGLAFWQRQRRSSVRKQG
jgi:hypothetical protein